MCETAQTILELGGKLMPQWGLAEPARLALAPHRRLPSAPGPDVDAMPSLEFLSKADDLLA